MLTPINQPISCPEPSLAFIDGTRVDIYSTREYLVYNDTVQYWLKV